MYVYSRVYLVILIFVICIDKINVYALPVWRLIKDIYIYVWLVNAIFDYLFSSLSIKELSEYIYDVRIVEPQCRISGCLQIIIYIQEHFPELLDER